MVSSHHTLFYTNCSAFNVPLLTYLVSLDKAANITSISPSEEVERRRKERHNERSQNRNSYSNNRLSVISSESDRRSSDSVEVLGSTSCTASPDSDLPTSLSASSLSVSPFSVCIKVLPGD